VRPRPLIILLLAVLTITTVGCQQYATVSTKQLHYTATTPAGHSIVQALQAPAQPPEVALGGFLDAAAKAADVLRRQPDDIQARTDYNFALSRAIEVVHRNGLEPWTAPIRCPGADGEWEFKFATPDRPDRHPSLFRIIPADRYQFRGALVTDRRIKTGVGAPLVVTSHGFDPREFDPFAQGKYLYYGMTAVLEFDGRRGVVTVHDPLSTEDIRFAGATHPLAADFTAPIALALAELQPRRVEIRRMFRPEEFRDSTRLARLQPFEADKIPVLFIHGLGDSQATWAPMIETLRGDATIRKNYQFWFFSYPTGYPFPYMAAVLRQQLDAIKKRYPDQKRLIVIGHSMGGMIARTLITDSGQHIWDAYFPMPPEAAPLSPDTLQLMKEALIFKPRPEISRVIFASASLRGSDLATGFLGRLGASIIGSPSDLAEVGDEVLAIVRPPPTGRPVNRMPNSVQFLDPNNRFLLTINELPTKSGVPFHSIIGDRGRGGNLDRTPPVSTDGIVPYWSSHIEGAKSELIVPSDHWSNRHPDAIAEVRRILVDHLKER